MSAKNKGGRPSKYKSAFDERAEFLCEESGFSQAKLAKAFGVGRTTITDWKHEHKSFAHAIQRGTDRFNTQLAERSLVKLVKGFKIKTKKETKDGTFVSERYIPPNQRSIEFLLTNRDPERWPNGKKIDLNGNVNVGNLSAVLDEIDGTTKGLEHDASAEE